MKLRYSEVADELIKHHWGITEEISPEDFIKKQKDHQNLIYILLIDIAQSLRILRCSIFNDIPNKLDKIVRQTRKPIKRKPKT